MSITISAIPAEALPVIDSGKKSSGDGQRLS
jgi:hypothetical protein